MLRLHRSNETKSGQDVLKAVQLRVGNGIDRKTRAVISKYTFQTQDAIIAGGIGGTVSSESAVQGDFLSLGTAGKYTDRPTITYTPITGQQFNMSFMTPIPPRAILFLMQASWPVDLIFPLTVDAVSGLRSRVAAGANQRAGDRKFYRVIELLRKIQVSGAVGMRILKESDQKESTVLFFYREALDAEIEAALGELNAILGLHREGNEVRVVYGLIPGGDQELAMLTRSMLHIMVELATRVDVPTHHVAEGRTIPSIIESDDGGEASITKLSDVRSGTDKPENAYTAVSYKDHWFWIDDRDFKSKRTFTFLMILFSLSESGGKESLPLVTIPAG